MHVTMHAQARIAARVGWRVAVPIIERLESTPGEPGTIAVELVRFPSPVVNETGSNGDMLVAIVVDGSVETIMLRRSWSQPFTPAALSVSRCVSLPM